MFNQVQKFLKQSSLVILMLLISAIAFSQDPGDNPDGPPPAVPFDDYLHVIIIAVGVALSWLVIRRNFKTKKA